MRREWREFWRQFGRHARFAPLWVLGGMLLSLPPALLSEDRNAVLRVSWAISAAIPFFIIVLFGTMYAVLTLIEIRGGVFRQPGVATHLALVVAGTIPGLVVGQLAGGKGAAIDFGSAWGTMLMAVLASLLFVFYEGWRGAREQSLRLQAETAEARYQALLAQMQPHFLFNALNGLSELIATEPSRASGMAQTLADLYRRVLEGSRTKTCTLELEAAIVRSYLELEGLRCGDRLTWKVDVPPDAAAIHLPSLVLQTLVENAVKHGISGSEDGGEVAVTVAREEDGVYRARVSNGGEPYAKGAGGTGIANTIARLDLLYGPMHAFAIGADAASGATVATFRFTGKNLG